MCKLHKVLLIIYTMTLAFLLVEKHDRNLLYKYSKNEQRTLIADTRCMVWSVLIHSAKVGVSSPPGDTWGLLLKDSWLVQEPQPSWRDPVSGKV